MLHSVEIAFSLDFMLQSPWTVYSRRRLRITLIPFVTPSRRFSVSVCPLWYFSFFRSPPYSLSLSACCLLQSLSPSACPTHLTAQQASLTTSPFCFVLWLCSCLSGSSSSPWNLTFSVITSLFFAHTQAPCDGIPSANFPPRTFTRTDSA